MWRVGGAAELSPPHLLAPQPHLHLGGGHLSAGHSPGVQALAHQLLLQQLPHLPAPGRDQDHRAETSGHQTQPRQLLQL